MAKTGQDLVNKAMTQVGKRYIFGYETKLFDPSPPAFDCSELVEWSLYQIGVKFVDGSRNQIAKCTKISVAQGLRTPGALLYKPGHIVISRGDNTTIEAKGRNYGVGVFSALNRFTQAGLVPALVYGNPTSPPVDLVAIARAIEAAKRQVLRRGSRGDAVKWAQVGINNLSGRGLTVDGDFGPATEKAVIDLQRWCHLSVDGVIGPRMWGILYP